MTLNTTTCPACGASRPDGDAVIDDWHGNGPMRVVCPDGCGRFVSGQPLLEEMQTATTGSESTRRRLVRELKTLEVEDGVRWVRAEWLRRFTG